MTISVLIADDQAMVRAGFAALLDAQFALVTLEGRTEPPALRFVRDFCTQLLQDEVAAGR